MGVAERKAREKEELRQRILGAATEMFVKEGFENVSMRKIAERIEYSPATIYLHFQDKVDLVASICTETFAVLEKGLQDIEEQGLTPQETLRRSLRYYIDFGLDNPSHYTFVFCTSDKTVLDIEKDSSRAIYGCGMGAFERLVRGLQRCMDAGVIRRDDVQNTAQSVWLMMHGLVAGLLLMTGFPFVEREALIEGTIDRIMRGLK